MSTDIYDYYTRLEPNHEVEVDEEGFQLVRCPFIDAFTPWSPNAGPDEVGCAFCEYLRIPHSLPEHGIGDAESPPITGGAHGSVHHVSEWQPCKVPLRRIDWVPGVSITTHEGGVASLMRISDRWAARGGHNAYRIRPGDTGSYNCRKTSSGNSWSRHAWANAIDVNWQTNPFSSRLITDMPGWFVQLWTDEGWGWGGNWKGNKDAMHFSKWPNEGGDGRLYVGQAQAPDVAPQQQEEEELMLQLSDKKIVVIPSFRMTRLLISSDNGDCVVRVAIGRHGTFGPIAGANAAWEVRVPHGQTHSAPIRNGEFDMVSLQFQPEKSGKGASCGVRLVP